MKLGRRSLAGAGLLWLYKTMGGIGSWRVVGSGARGRGRREYGAEENWACEWALLVTVTLLIEGWDRILTETGQVIMMDAEL